MKRAAPPVIFTDDCWIFTAQAGVPAADLKAKVVDGYAGTGGALWWSTGDHEVYLYETEIGEIFGANSDALDPTSPSFVHSATPGIENQLATNLRQLIAASGGPLTALSGLCRDAGIPFFPRVRVNSHYVIDPSHLGYGSFRRENPDLLIGRPGEIFPENSVQWGIRTGLDFAHTAVRDHVYRIACETFERFDVDGVELDFMRHSTFFRMEESLANAYLMTDLVARIKTRLDQVAAKRGKTLQLAVRVPATIADCRRIGLDVEHWIQAGLVDIAVVGGGFISFETPVDEFVHTAANTPCLIYGCIEATRHIDRHFLRALALRWLTDGADGIYLYNFYSMAPEWNRQTAAEFSDLATLRKLDKRYEISPTQPFSPTEGHSAAFRHAHPSTPLPVPLPADTELGPTLKIRVSDEIQGVTGSLALRVKNLAPEDQLEVRLNGHALSWDRALVNNDGWMRQQVATLFWANYPTYPEQQKMDGTSVEYAIHETILKQGINEIEVQLKSNDQVTGTILTGVELSISHAKS